MCDWISGTVLSPSPTTQQHTTITRHITTQNHFNMSYRTATTKLHTTTTPYCVCADDLTRVDLSDAHVLFANSTMFNATLMEALRARYPEAKMTAGGGEA